MIAFTTDATDKSRNIIHHHEIICMAIIFPHSSRLEATLSTKIAALSFHDA
jgi:hypothetical protein